MCSIRIDLHKTKPSQFRFGFVFILTSYKKGRVLNKARLFVEQ